MTPTPKFEGAGSLQGSLQLFGSRADLVDDLVRQLQHGEFLEGVVPGAQLPQHDGERVHVDLPGIRLVVDDLQA